LVGFEDYADIFSFGVEMGITVVADVAWGTGMDCVVTAHKAVVTRKPESSSLFVEDVAWNDIFATSFLRS